jgi:uncharacterized repeat protein (TIGR01451 family)
MDAWRLRYGCLAILLACLLVAAAEAQQMRPIVGPPSVTPGGIEPREPLNDEPQVSITVRVPASIARGQQLHYEIVVRNRGKAAAHHVTVRVTLPTEQASFVSASPEPDQKSPVYVWKFGTLEGCSRRTIHLTVKPVGKEEVSCCARVQFEHGQCVRTRVGRGTLAPSTSTPEPKPGLKPVKPLPAAVPKPAAASLQVTKIAPTEVTLYDSFTCKLEVRNVGGQVARDVVLRDQLPDAVLMLGEIKPAPEGNNPYVWKLGDLQPGQAKVIEYSAAARKVGVHSSIAIVEGQGGLRHQSRHEVRVGKPGLQVAIAGPLERPFGREITYLLTVSNPGDRPVHQVELHNDLPPQVEAVQVSHSGRVESLSPENGEPAGGKRIRWMLGNLQAGERRTVSLRIRPQQRLGESLKIVCTARAEKGLLEQASIVTRLPEMEGLFIEIDKSVDPLEVNETTLLTFRICNKSKVTHSNIDVRLQLPAGLRCIELHGKRLSNSAHLPTVRLERLPQLAPNQEQQTQLRLQADRVGAMPLVVELTSDQLGRERPTRLEETLNVIQPLRSRSLRPAWLP